MLVPLSVGRGVDEATQADVCVCMYKQALLAFEAVHPPPTPC